MSVSLAPPASAFHRRLCHNLLQHSAFYKSEVAPFLRSQHPCTVNWLLASAHPQLSVLCRDRQTKELYPSIRDGIRDRLHSPVDPMVSLAALQWLQNTRKRFDQSRACTLTHKEYEFNVGDLVYHTQLGQVGVIAAQLPVCFEPDEWVRNQLGSVTDPRVSHPWYMIILARHAATPLAVNLTRYGSALTHRKVQVAGSIGFHPLLPLYFSSFDHEKGAYVPRTDTHLFTKIAHPHIAKQQQISFESLAPQKVSAVAGHS